MKIAICDDDWHMQQTLRLFIDQTYQDLDMLVDGFTSGEPCLLPCRNRSSLTNSSCWTSKCAASTAIETAKRLRKLLPDCYIIFITSHDEFALTGYEVAAFRYLVKPVQPEKLTEAISAVRAELSDHITLHVEDGPG